MASSPGLKYPKREDYLTPVGSAIVVNILLLLSIQELQTERLVFIRKQTIRIPVRAELIAIDLFTQIIMQSEKQAEK